MLSYRNHTTGLKDQAVLPASRGHLTSGECGLALSRLVLAPALLCLTCQGSPRGPVLPTARVRRPEGRRTGPAPGCPCPHHRGSGPWGSPRPTDPVSAELPAKANDSCDQEEAKTNGDCHLKGVPAFQNFSEQVMSRWALQPGQGSEAPPSRWLRRFGPGMAPPSLQRACRRGLARSPSGRRAPRAPTTRPHCGASARTTRRGAHLNLLVGFHPRAAISQVAPRGGNGVAPR